MSRPKGSRADEVAIGVWTDERRSAATERGGKTPIRGRRGRPDKKKGTWRDSNPRPREFKSIILFQRPANGREVGEDVRALPD